MTVEQEYKNCPTCGAEVIVAYRADGSADHLEAKAPIDRVLPEIDEKATSVLRERRKGKKTVALVGMGQSSAGLAPYKEDVELWSLNETHLYAWMQRATRWFQIHPREIWTRELSGRGEKGHAEWIRQNPWGIPVYMRFYNNEVIGSVEYPLQEMAEEFFGNFERGTEDVETRYFRSTFAYMMALAIHEGFERIEPYGFDFHSGTDFAKQRECALFWIGMAMGRGITVAVPHNSELLVGPLYGFSDG
jgi:hypothetical protein